MHSVDLLEEALVLAVDLGFEVRQEWLQERGGGACRIGSKWILFVDLSLSAAEQLEQVLAGINQCNPGYLDPNISPELAAKLRAAARA